MTPGSAGELLMAQILLKWQVCFPALKVGPSSPLLDPFSLSGWSLFWFGVLNMLMFSISQKATRSTKQQPFSHWPRRTASFEECGHWDGICLRRPEQERCLWRPSMSLETELGWGNACFSLSFVCFKAFSMWGLATPPCPHLAVSWNGLAPDWGITLEAFSHSFLLGVFGLSELCLLRCPGTST